MVGSARRRLARAATAALLGTALLGAAAAALAGTAFRIEGNTALGTQVLREAAAAELAGVEEPARRRAAAADAAYQMERAGRRAGHAFIEVGYEVTGESEDAVVVFRVSEGPRVALGDVTFSGNAFFSAAELRRHLAGEAGAPYVEADLRDGRQTIGQLYRDQGFADVRVADPQATFRAGRTVADLHVEIVEGTRYLIRGVVFEGDPLPDADPVLQRLAADLPGQPFHGRRSLELANAVTRAYTSRGYPDAGVLVRDEPGGRAGDVVLRFAVASGPRVRISRVDVVGNERTRASFVRSRMPLGAGDWYDEEALHEGFRELYRAGIFSRVDHSLEGAGDERVLRIEVQEAPAREAYGEVGWGSYELLRGRVGYRDRNLLGTGRTAGVETGASTKSLFVAADVLSPRLLGTDLTLSVPVSWRFREEPTYTEEEVELSARVYRLFPGRVTAGLKYAFRFDGLSHLSPDLPPEARDERYTAASLKATLDVDRRDDLFYPSRGWQGALAAEVADRRLGGSLDFVRATGRARGYLSLGAGFVFALRLDTGFIVPSRGSEDLPVKERFFAGGENSVRSFEEQQLGPKGPSGDPLGGLASTLVAVEVRRRIAGNLAGTVFADFGNVAPNRSLSGAEPGGTTAEDPVDAMWKDYLKDFRAGLGFGLQYLTPVGPARIDLAWNPSPREEENEESFAWHFSLGMAF